MAATMTKAKPLRVSSESILPEELAGNCIWAHLGGIELELLSIAGRKIII